MRRIVPFLLLAALACTDDAPLTAPSQPVTGVATQASATLTTFGDTTLYLELDQDKALTVGDKSQFVHLRATVKGTPIAASGIKARFTSNNPKVISVPNGGTPDDDRTRLYPNANGTASVTAEWTVNGRTYKASQPFTVGTAADTVIELYLDPARTLTAGDKSVFVHARVKVSGTALPASQTFVTFTSSTTSVIALPNGGTADDDRTRVYAVSSGKATITARWTRNGRTYTGSREFTVGSTSTPPPSPGPKVRECDAPGTGWIFCDDFDLDRLSRYFEHSNRSRFRRVAGVGVGGSPGMQADFSAGTVDAGTLKLAFGRVPSSYMRTVDGGTAKYREIYWRVYVRFGSNWTGGSGHKLSRATSLVSSNWAQSMIGHIWSSRDPLSIDPASGTSTSGVLRTTKYNDFDNLRWLGAQRGSTPIAAQRNVWHCVEARVLLNTAGQSNGVMQMWVNGALDAERTGLNWVGSYSDYGINAVFLENYWNGGAPQAQSRYMDNFVVSTRRIGC